MYVLVLGLRLVGTVAAVLGLFAHLVGLLVARVGLLVLGGTSSRHPQGPRRRSQFPAEGELDMYV